MIELSIMQAFTQHNERRQRAGKQNRSLKTFWAWLQRTGWPLRIDAARGVVVGVPDEWGEEKNDAR